MTRKWQEPNGLHLDLRGLEPPEPMVAILREIDGGATGPLIVHMDREPVFLFQDLVERGWGWDIRFQGGVPDDPDSPEQARVTLVLKPEDT